MKKTLALLGMPTLFILSACSSEAEEPAESERVLNFRNAEIYQGRAYAGDENEPYTGLITDFPISAMPVKKIVDLASVAGGIAGDPTTHSYMLESSILSMLQGGAPALCNARFSAGYLHGRAECNTNNNLPLLDATYVDGRLNGHVALYSLKDGDGNKLAQVEIINDKFVGEFIVYGAITSQPVHIEPMDNGFTDGLLRKFSDNEYNNLILERNYEYGTPAGVERTFDPETGVLISSKYVHQWGEFDNPDDIDLDSCAQSWVDFYNGQSEEPLTFRYDELNELRQRCAEGDRPEV